MKEQGKLPVALFNGTVATTNGLYEIKDIDEATARQYVKRYGYISAVGHQATAEIMSTILQTPIPMNRIQFFQEVGQLAIVFKLNERPEEGIVLNKQQIEKIGYSLKIMQRLQ